MVQHEALGPEQHRVVLLQDHLDPGGGHIGDGALDIAAPHPLHVHVGDEVALVDVDVLPVVGLEADLRDGLGQGGQVVGGRGGQLGLQERPVRLIVVDGRPVGQHRRGGEGQVLLPDLGGEGAVGPAGGHGEPAALPQEVVQGPAVAVVHCQVVIVERVVVVADQQHAVKSSHRLRPLSPFTGGCPPPADICAPTRSDRAPRTPPP